VENSAVLFRSSNTTINTKRDVGYFKLPQKEFFQMRLTDASDFPWPRHQPQFKRKMLQCYGFLDELTRVCLEVLAHGIEVDPSKFLQLLDPNPLPSQQYSNNLLSVFRYFGTKQGTETCDIHKDMGIISFIPVADVPGLQIMDYQTVSWVDIECVAEKSEVVVIIGETLDRLSAAYYPASVHRVIASAADKPRTSIVYKARGKSTAILDPVGLNSKVLGKIPQFFEEPISIADFLQEHAGFYDSVNFPGNSGRYEAYAKCIMNPNTNKIEPLESPREVEAEKNQQVN